MLVLCLTQETLSQVIEVLSNTLVRDGVRQEDSSHFSRKGLKVPLKVNEGTDTAVGGSEQPQSKGSLMSSNSYLQVGEGLTSSRMEESLVYNSVVNLPDQEVTSTDRGARDQPYACISSDMTVNPPYHDHQNGARCCSAVNQNSVPLVVKMSSQELLKKGNKTLMEQLIEEMERGHKTIYKSAEKDIIKSMLNDPQCMLTEEEKPKVVELLHNYKEIIVPGLSPEFRGGNAFFKPHRIVLAHNDPI